MEGLPKTGIPKHRKKSRKKLMMDPPESRNTKTPQEIQEKTNDGSARKQEYQNTARNPGKR